MCVCMHVCVCATSTENDYIGQVIYQYVYELADSAYSVLCKHVMYTVFMPSHEGQLYSMLHELDFCTCRLIALTIHMACVVGCFNCRFFYVYSFNP